MKEIATGQLVDRNLKAREKKENNIYKTVKTMKTVHKIPRNCVTNIIMKTIKSRIDTRN